MHPLLRPVVVWMRVVALLVGAGLSAVAAAQARAPGPVPLQRAGATVQISEHVYVIPDFKVGMVPNVGIVVGSRATLVVDPGMGLKNGQVVLREVQQVSQGPDLYISQQEPSNFWATSVRYQLRIVSGLPIVATSCRRLRLSGGERRKAATCDLGKPPPSARRTLKT